MSTLTNPFTAPYDAATDRTGCPYCPLTAPGRVSRGNHSLSTFFRDHILMTHLNLAPFPCPGCANGSTAKDLLHEHIASTHHEHVAHYLAVIQEPRQLIPEPGSLAIRYGTGPGILLVGIVGANNAGADGAGFNNTGANNE